VIEKLTPIQAHAVKMVVDKSKAASMTYEEKLMQRVKSFDALRKLLLYIRDTAPIIIHIKPENCLKLLNDTHYRNLFEIGRGSGCCHQPSRAGWETRMFDGIYDSATPHERVKYGVLNILNDPYGVKACISYGDCYLKLKLVRLRTSFADCDSSSPNTNIASCEYYCHVLHSFNDLELGAALDVALNNQKYHNSSVIGTYKEIQIHGPVKLDEHVEALVVHPKHRKNTGLIANLTKLCDKNKFPLLWMDKI
jgi:hypothetical protein